MVIFIKFESKLVCLIHISYLLCNKKRKAALSAVNLFRNSWSFEGCFQILFYLTCICNWAVFLCSCVPDLLLCLCCSAPLSQCLWVHVKPFKDKQSYYVKMKQHFVRFPPEACQLWETQEALRVHLDLKAHSLRAVLLWRAASLIL